MSKALVTFKERYDQLELTLYIDQKGSPKEIAALFDNMLEGKYVGTWLDNFIKTNPNDVFIYDGPVILDSPYYQYKYFVDSDLTSGYFTEELSAKEWNPESKDWDVLYKGNIQEFINQQDFFKS